MSNGMPLGVGIDYIGSGATQWWRILHDSFTILSSEAVTFQCERQDTELFCGRRRTKDSPLIWS